MSPILTNCARPRVERARICLNFLPRIRSQRSPRGNLDLPSLSAGFGTTCARLRTVQRESRTRLCLRHFINSVRRASRRSPVGANPTRPIGRSAGSNQGDERWDSEYQNSSTRDTRQQTSTPCKSAISSGCESHPANRSLGRKQPERRKEVTTCVEVLW